MNNNSKPDDLQKIVNNTSKDISSLYPNLNLHIVHYLTGPTKKPYSLRRSAAWFNPESWLQKEIVNVLKKSNLSQEELRDQVQLHHDEVLKKYIRYLDRSNTFLNLAINQFPLNETKDEYELFIGTLSIEESNNKKPSYTFPKLPTKTKKDDKYLIEWKLNRKAANILLPNGYFKDFFPKLYSNSMNKEDEDIWRMNFMLAKAELFGKKENLPERYTPQKICETSKIRREIWRTLSAIQSIILYFKAAYKDKRNKSGPGINEITGNILILRKAPQKNDNDSKDTKDTEMAILTISPAFQNSQLHHNTNDLKNKLKDMLRNIHYVEDKQESIERITSDYMEATYGIYSNNLIKNLKNHIYPSYTYDCHLRIKVNWALILITKLQGQIHEGQLLSFFLVCGELSEFEDSHNTIIRSLQKENNLHKKELEKLGWSTDEIERLSESKDDESEEDKKKRNIEDIKSKATKVANFIYKEHYPWFERGRHALFLDIASGDPCPTGLVTASPSSWEYIVNERFRQDIRFDIPNCVVFYVCGDPQSSGIIVIT